MPWPPRCGNRGEVNEPSVQTIGGPVPASELGVTLTHEHLMVNLRCNWSPSDDPGLAFLPLAPERLGRIRANPFAARDNLLIDEPQVMAGELRRYREAGGRTIVDATPPGLGRDVRTLAWLQEQAGVNVIAGCGYYVQATHPPGMETRSVDEIAAEMIRDIREGMDGTDLRAGVIGEIGVTAFPMHPDERKVLEAAAVAQRETGCAIITHSAAGDDSPFEVLGVLAGAGADLTRVIQSHLDDRFRTELDSYRRVAEMGANLGLDTFGRHLYYRARQGWLASDDVRISAVVMLIEDGLVDHILPAQDICFKHELGAYGGHGYEHFMVNIVPRLIERGVTHEQIDRILRLNPARVLSRHSID